MFTNAHFVKKHQNVNILWFQVAASGIHDVPGERKHTLRRRDGRRWYMYV